MKYMVVTRVPDVAADGTGNLAVSGEIYVQTQDPSEANGWRGRARRAFEALGPAAINLRVPVFTLGEIIVHEAGDDREAIGAQRKPSKWDVSTEDFDTIEAAIERSRAILRDREEAFASKDLT